MLPLSEIRLGRILWEKIIHKNARTPEHVAMISITQDQYLLLTCMWLGETSFLLGNTYWATRYIRMNTSFYSGAGALDTSCCTHTDMSPYWRRGSAGRKEPAGYCKRTCKCWGRGVGLDHSLEVDLCACTCTDRFLRPGPCLGRTHLQRTCLWGQREIYTWGETESTAINSIYSTFYMPLTSAQYWSRGATQSSEA